MKPDWFFSSRSRISSGLVPVAKLRLHGFREKYRIEPCIVRLRKVGKVWLDVYTGPNEQNQNRRHGLKATDKCVGAS
jgi:hypothetical protein